MASKYIVVLFILVVTAFLALGVKRLLLLRAGFGTQKKSVNWFLVALLLLMTVVMLSCNSKTADNTTQEAETEQKEPVLVTQEEEKATAVNKQIDGKGNVTATVTTSVKSSDGEIVTEEKVFKGTRQEVDAQIKEATKK
jgi:type III secretory pathway component EscR